MQCFDRPVLSRRLSSYCHLNTKRFTRRMPVLLLVLLACLPAVAQVVTSDFEDGTDGWTGFAGASVATSNLEANTGSNSLLVSNRTQTYQGPGIDLTQALTLGQPYTFKIAVRLSDSTPGSDTVHMTMMSTINGSQTFNTVATATATNTGWVTMSGTFASATTGVSDLFLYVEDDSNANAEYYVDTFSVTATNGGCTVPPDNSGFDSTFEDGNTDGWAPRFGLGAVANTTADAHTGTHSLLTTGRTATYQGPALDITGKMCNGQQYWVEAWVKMAPGQPPTSLNLSLQLTDASGNLTFPGVANSPVEVTDSAWVRIKSKPYTFSGAYTDLMIYIQSNENPTASFYIDDVMVQYMPPPVIENIPPIDQAYAGDFPVGFAALQSDLSGAHGQLAALHYNSVTPGNDLKWDTTEPTEGNFNFGPGDNILAFAQSHGMKMRGHNFVWYQQVPNWVFEDAGGVDMSTEPFSQANKQLLLSRLQNHINALINHYQGNIYVWDVVNEAIDETQPDGFRRSKWYQITVDPSAPPAPPEYMDDAFIYARQALDNLGLSRKQVELCYNDFNTTISAKQQFIYSWVKGAIARGVPIDCVGNQFHNTINFPIDDQGSASSKQSVISTLNLFASLTSTAGVPIVNQITEFDISLYRYGNCSQTFYFDNDDLLAGDTADLINQGYRYRDYFQIFRNLKNEIDSVTIWGLGDDDSWLNPSANVAGCSGITAADAPLPFNVYLQHKYAYTGLVNPLALPGANIVTTIAANSGTVLNGSSATYVITATNNGPLDAAGLTFSDTLPANTTFQSFTPASGWTCTTPAVGGTGQISCTAPALTNGSAAQFTLVVNIPCATANGTAITNTATVTSTTANPNPTPQNSASVTITSSDPAPVISGLRVDFPLLWPPAGEFVPEFVSYRTSATCDPNPKLALSAAVSANQKDKDLNRDFKVIDPHHIWLEAENTPRSQERTYTITVTATDSAGASSSGSVEVKVLRFP